MEFIIEESAAYVQGGGRDMDGTRRKSDGKVEEEGANQIQLRSKRKEDGHLQVQAVNPHLGSHMISPLHKIYRQKNRLSGRGWRRDWATQRQKQLSS